MLNTIIKILIPPTCVNCNCRVLEYHNLCFKCWQELVFITLPACNTCGYPSDYNLDISFNNASCAQCSRGEVFYNKALSLMHYNDLSKKLILQFKNQDYTHFAKIFAQIMARVDCDFMHTIDYLVPVPLHWQKLLIRGFNQSALIAMHFLKATPHNMAYSPFLLRKIKNNTDQKQKTLNDRLKSLKNSFIVPKKHQKLLRGKNILLIDDVMTTGATVNECSKALKKAGCNCVYVLTLARTIKHNNF